MVTLRPAALDQSQKENLLRVCDEASIARAGDNLSFAVDQSYQAHYSFELCLI